jgi:hypothetical protein
MGIPLTSLKVTQINPGCTIWEGDGWLREL